MPHDQRTSVDLPKLPSHAKSWSDGVQTVNLADLRGTSGRDAFATLATQRKGGAAGSQTAGQVVHLSLTLSACESLRSAWLENCLAVQEPSEMAGADSLSAPKSPTRTSDAPICLEARLPPLHPKTCARFMLMAAGHGSLFAGKAALRSYFPDQRASLLGVTQEECTAHN